MSTENAFDMVCPCCGASDQIDVAATVFVRLCRDGTDDAQANNGDHTWDDDSPALCCACDYARNGPGIQPMKPRSKKSSLSYDRNMEPITPTEYRAFQRAYDFFNAELFGSSLPHVLVTLQRHARARGYFSPERFSGRVEEATVHELALNPDTFTDRTDEEILSTLAHEMAHVWQQTHGKPPTRCYHDRQWAAKMKEIGLQPTDTGEPGGKETGQSVTHYIMPGGAYARAYAKLKATGFQLHWQSAPQGKEASAKRASKTKFTCPDCGQNAWAKPDARLICGECYEEDNDAITLMLAEDSGAADRARMPRRRGPSAAPGPG